MPTGRERMLELSTLPTGARARDHFLSIVLTAGTTTVYGELEAQLMAEYNVELEQEYQAEIENNEFEVELEKEIEVEVC